MTEYELYKFREKYYEIPSNVQLYKNSNIFSLNI